MTLSRKFFSSQNIATLSACAALVCLPGIAAANDMLSGVDLADPQAYVDKSGAVSLLALSSTDAFSPVGGSARISAFSPVAKTNIPGGTVPVPASLALLAVGAVAAAMSRKRVK